MLEIEKPDDGLCDSCLMCSANDWGTTCAVTGDELVLGKTSSGVIRFITQLNCPLKKLEDICNQKTLEK
jgi:hypothetical protein